MYDYDYSGKTALHWAIQKELIDMIKFLLEKNSNINAMDIAKRTPLHFAAKQNNLTLSKVK